MYPLLKIRYKRNFDRRKTSLIMIVKKSIIFNVFDLYMFCPIWYHLYNLKNVKSTHGRVLFLVKLQAKSLQLY